VPLDRYGVLVGVLHRSFRDPPDDQGRWFHVNLEVDAPAGRHRGAVDVVSMLSAVGVQWRLLTVPPRERSTTSGTRLSARGRAACSSTFSTQADRTDGDGHPA
jgi:hypothetical protein